MSHLQVYLSMSDKFTINTERIVDVTLWIAFVFVVFMMVTNKISSNPATQQLKLDLPSFPASTLRNWGINYPVIEGGITTEIECMALNLYFEARGESIEAQYAVADVVMYRVMHYNFPDTICGVIKDGIYPSWNDKIPYKWRCSFTWHCDRKSDIPRDKNAFKTAKYIAKDVILNNAYEPVLEYTLKYALYYHADYVSPDWGHIFVGKIGKHLFYVPDIRSKKVLDSI